MWEPQGVVFLGIEKGERRPSFSGRVISPRDFVELFDWTFLNGIDQDGSIYGEYDATMDTYWVIGADGRVRYISPVVSFELGAINVAAIEDAIRSALSATPVRSTTWSRLKLLWP